MADKITHTEQVVMVGEFLDGDDRSIALDSPNVDVTDQNAMTLYGSKIRVLGERIRVKKLLIGDKDGADFTRFKSAKVVKKTVTKLDLTA